MGIWGVWKRPQVNWVNAQWLKGKLASRALEFLRWLLEEGSASCWWRAMGTVMPLKHCRSQHKLVGNKTREEQFIPLLPFSPAPTKCLFIYAVFSIFPLPSSHPCPWLSVYLRSIYMFNRYHLSSSLETWKALRKTGTIPDKVQNNLYKGPFNDVILKKPQQIFQEKLSSHFPGCVKILPTAAAVNEAFSL